MAYTNNNYTAKGMLPPPQSKSMAYTNNNYTAKGMLPPPQSGNVADFWMNWHKVINVNDGKRNFSLKTKDNKHHLMRIKKQLLNSLMKIMTFHNFKMDF